MRPSFFLFVALVLLAGDARSQSRWMSQHEDDQGRRYEVDLRGDVQFTDDDRGIVSLTPDGSFRLLHRDGSHSRELVVRADGDGSLSYDYRVDGSAAAWDDQAGTAMGTVILAFIRHSGINAPERVARILAKDGVEGVLKEIGYIESSGGSTRYFMALVDQGRLSSEQLARLAHMAPERIGSSGDRSRFLVHAAERYMADEQASLAFFDAACTVPSSGDRSRVLIKALASDLGYPAARALISCAKGIPSDGDLSRVLIVAAATFSTRPDYRDAYFGAVAEIGSSGDRSRVLINLLDRDDLDEATLMATLESAAGIGSSGDKSRVLLNAAPRVQSDRLVDAYLAAAETIGSSGDRARALSALVAAN